MPLKRNRSPQEKKDKMLRIRISTAEYEELQKLAEREGLAIANFVRIRLLGGQTSTSRTENQDK